MLYLKVNLKVDFIRQARGSTRCVRRCVRRIVELFSQTTMHKATKLKICNDEPTLKLDTNFPTPFALTYHSPSSEIVIYTSEVEGSALNPTHC